MTHDFLPVMEQATDDPKSNALVDSLAFLVGVLIVILLAISPALVIAAWKVLL